ncbi:MAG: flagellar hook-associated protein FlgK [Cryobacterium sp.]
MSTFGGLNTALSGLVAARTGLDVVGQNIANATTEGYTRQRISTSAAGATAQTGMVDQGARVGQGVSVDGIARLGSAQLDLTVRTAAAASGYSAIRANSLAAMESSLKEPGDNGLSAQLSAFWAGWQDLSNNADAVSPAALLLERAGELTAQIRQGHQAIDSEWSSVRGSLTAMVSELNTAATEVADLNVQIRTIVASGGSANELLDRRSALTTTIAALSGATVREQHDGTVTVLVGGSALVAGGTAGALSASGASRLSGLSDATAVSLSWAGSGQTVSLQSGEIAGAVSLLAPVTPGGSGGAIAEAAAGYDAFAADLAGKVNAIYGAGTGAVFFSGTTASTLSVAVTSATGVIAGDPAKGTYDGSIADAIAQLGAGAATDAAGAAIDSPSTAWSNFVTTLGVQTQSALQNAKLDGLTSTAAVGQQLANSSVDMDEENVNMLMYQTAYQAAARVMTAVDEMLDILINRTGLVGR